MFKYGYKAGWLNIGDFFCYRWNPCFYMPLLVGGGTQPYCRTNLKCQRAVRMTNYPPPATHSHSAPPSPRAEVDALVQVRGVLGRMDERALHAGTGRVRGSGRPWLARDGALCVPCHR